MSQLGTAISYFAAGNENGQRRRQVLIHACLYYRLDTDVVDDHTYDRWSKELADLQVQYPEDAIKATSTDQPAITYRHTYR